MDTQLITPPQLAESIGIPVRTLDQWRHRHVGPSYIKVGRHVRYRPADVEAWLATRRHEVGGAA